MFNFLLRKLKYTLTKGKIANEIIHPEVKIDSEIGTELKKNIDEVKGILGDSDDIIIRSSHFAT